MNRDCLKAFGEGYEPPTPSEVRQAFERYSSDDSEVARLIGVKNARSVKRWKQEEGPSKRHIDYAHWRLFLIASKRIAP